MNRDIENTTRIKNQEVSFPLTDKKESVTTGILYT